MKSSEVRKVKTITLIACMFRREVEAARLVVEDVGANLRDTRQPPPPVGRDIARMIPDTSAPISSLAEA